MSNLRSTNVCPFVSKEGTLLIPSVCFVSKVEWIGHRVKILEVGEKSFFTFFLGSS